MTDAQLDLNPVKRLFDLLGQMQHELGKLGVAEPAKAAVPQLNQPKLTDRQVREIRWLKSNTKASQKEIAEAYDINPATVSRIVRGIYHR